MQISKPGSLHDFGAQIRVRFQRLLDLKLTGAEVGWQRHVADEADRFELWAINLGLFAPSHASLDYRVRDAENVKGALERYLTDLVASLEEASSYLASPNDAAEGEAGDEEDSDDDFIDDDLEGEELTNELLLDSIRDPINRLYRTSLWIRNPSSRFASSNALQHRKIDDETGVDLLKAFEPFDRCFIRSLFFRPCSTTEEEKDTCRRLYAGKGKAPILTDHEPISRQENEFLIQRLTRANYRRRQQFSYWRHHRVKLAIHADASAPPTLGSQMKEGFGRHSGPMAASVHDPLHSVTTATLLHPHQTVPFRDDMTTGTLSIYAASQLKAAQDQNTTFPQPPSIDSDKKYFECPYCFTLCPTKMCKPEAWRAHLIHDLRPYVCMHADCKTEDQLYDRRQDWIQHQVTEHGCDSKAETKGAGGILSSRRLVQEVSRDCPLCLSTVGVAEDIHSHMARHLERISLFALPRDIALETDDEGSGGNANDNSDQADVNAHNSRAGDFSDEELAYTLSDDDDEGRRRTKTIPDGYVDLSNYPNEFNRKQMFGTQPMDRMHQNLVSENSAPSSNAPKAEQPLASQLKCPYCIETPIYFRDYRGLESHMKASHPPDWKTYFKCVDTHLPPLSIPTCQPCTDGKLYESWAHAFAHLRKAHFLEDTNLGPDEEWFKKRHIKEVNIQVHPWSGPGGIPTDYNKREEDAADPSGSASQGASKAPQGLPQNMPPHVSADVNRGLTNEQRDVLEAYFQDQHKPSKATKKGFAESLNVPVNKINNWFQNRKARAKQDRKRLLTDPQAQYCSYCGQPTGNHDYFGCPNKLNPLDLGTISKDRADGDMAADKPSQEDPLLRLNPFHVEDCDTATKSPNRHSEMIECTKCAEVSKSNTEHEDHMLQHGGPYTCRVPGCPQGDVGFFFWSELDKHMNSIHAPKNNDEWQVDQMPVDAITNSERLNLSDDTHVSPRNSPENSPQKLPQKSLETTEHDFTGDSSSVACSRCGKVLTGPYAAGNLTRHQKSRSCASCVNRRTFVCDFKGCQNQYERSDALLNHKRRKHGHPAPLKKSTEPPGLP